MSISENLSNYCPLRVTKETLQLGNRVIIPQNQIPGEGCCSASERGESPCMYPSDAQHCSRLRRQDLCQFSWAISESLLRK